MNGQRRTWVQGSHSQPFRVQETSKKRRPSLVNDKDKTKVVIRFIRNTKTRNVGSYTILGLVLRSTLKHSL